mmetsp:Transcript_20861/g.25759  ORF Transcript_20861/g.25759 Transcript_20861/m.25759 type:complete len:94 (-) Transcript_20861:126-407(-)|eukprot:CAMPEP_0114651356 /NCGR_PEP_ID=MMETSP0191-20121206/8272_1 /TAXON_ID=126664 /ORGANISM="Sorites sp." /LENGTH=93 /DNA_ID=CAMNT_0001865509 /DNA_START=44 /DNA_END=325 /DNA_ORIENTATION=-
MNDGDLGFTKRKMSIREKFQHEYQNMSPTMQRGTIGFGYGFLFGSTIGILGGIQHLGNEELRFGRRIVKMAKSGVAVGAMCGVFVTVGFTVLR